MHMDEWFCTPIAIFRTDNFDLTDHCLKVKDKYPLNPQNPNEWIHQPYNTQDTIGYNVKNDSKFIDLHQWVQKCVHEFSVVCGYDRMEQKSVWFNVYGKGDSQEFHVHPHSNFSCIYVAAAGEDDPRIIFQRSPWKMHPSKIITPNRYNWQQIWYKPLTGMLFIFDSDTAHMVERKVTDTPRITFAYNFSTEIPE